MNIEANQRKHHKQPTQSAKSARKGNIKTHSSSLKGLLAVVILAMIGFITGPVAHANILVSGTAAPTSIAVQRAIIPIITITVTNTERWDSVVSGIHVRRKGNVSDDNFGRTILLRDDGLIGWSGSPFDINHESVIQGYPVSNGQARTWTLAILMANDLSAYAGKTVGFDIVGIDASSMDGRTNILASSLPILGGTMTISAANLCGDLVVHNSSQDQNVMIGAPRQLLGEFDFVVSGEQISLPFLDVYFESTLGNVSNLTSVTIVNDQNVTIAGPVDVSPGEEIGGPNGSAHFTDTLTLPKGTNHLYVKGRSGNGLPNMCKIRANVVTTSLQPQGQVYGWKFLLNQRDWVSGSVMTLRSPALTVGFDSTTRNWQTVVPGSAVAFGSIVLSALDSSEDIILSSLPITLTTKDGAVATDITNIILWDGTNALNTGANVVNVANDGVKFFPLDKNLVVKAGTVTTIVPKGFLSSNAKGTYKWSVVNSITATGLTSSIAAQVGLAQTTDYLTAIYGTTNAPFPVSVAQTTRTGNSTTTFLTVSGSPGYSYAVQASSNLVNWTTIALHQSIGYTASFVDTASAPYMFYRAIPHWNSRLIVNLDFSTPPESAAVGGSSGVAVAAYRLAPFWEGTAISRIPVKLSAGVPENISALSLWNGSTLLATTVFTGGSTNAVFNIDPSNTITIAQDDEKVLTIKADFSPIGTSFPVNTSGARVVVELDFDRTNIWNVVGLSSGQQIVPGVAATIANGMPLTPTGVRIFKSIPHCEAIPIAVTGMSDGALYRFKVTADAAGPISLAKTSFFLQGTSVAVSGISLFGYEDSGFSQPIAGFGELGGKVATAADTNAIVFAADGTSSVDGYTLAGRYLEMFVRNPKGFLDSITIPAGQSRYFEVRSMVQQGVVSSSVFYTTMKFDSPPTGMSTTYPLMPDSSFIWSPDTFGIPDLYNSADWTSSPGPLLDSTIHQVRIP